MCAGAEAPACAGGRDGRCRIGRGLRWRGRGGRGRRGCGWRRCCLRVLGRWRWRGAGAPAVGPGGRGRAGAVGSWVALGAGADRLGHWRRVGAPGHTHGVTGLPDSEEGFAGEQQWGTENRSRFV
jgi:hypothetical protein